MKPNLGIGLQYFNRSYFLNLFCTKRILNDLEIFFCEELNYKEAIKSRRCQAGFHLLSIFR
jgi:hypothetical protein